MLSALTLLVLLVAALSNSGLARVTLMLGDRELANNSAVAVSEINEGGRALMCTTDRRGCCISVRDGDWFYPNGSRVQLYGVGWGMYRTRLNGVVRLNRRRDVVASGLFHCEVHGDDNVRKKLFVDVRSTDAAAVITVQPGDNHVLPGQDVTFYVTAVGLNLVYLWQFSDGSQLPANDERVEGIRTDDLTIRNVTAFDAGVYQCAVSNAGGTVFSRAARLSVAGPAVIVQPQSAHSVDPGADVVFTLRAVRATRVRWRKDGAYLQDGNKYSGTRRERLAVYNVSAADAGDYVCVVSDNAVDVLSNPATLSLLDPPVIVREPENQLDVTPGSNATYSVHAEGMRLSYVWERSGEGGLREDDHSIIGRNTSVLTVLEVTLADVGTYRCVVSNNAGSARSTAAILSLGTCPPGEVTLLQASTSSTSALITWEPPLYLAGFTVTVYEVKLGALTYPVDPEFSNVTSTQLLAVGLIPGARYAFEVRAYTAAGAGELARTEADVSRTFSAVEDLVASTDGNNLTVVEISWRALQVPGWSMAYYYLYYAVNFAESISNHLLRLPDSQTSFSLHLPASDQSLLYTVIRVSGVISLGLEGMADFESEATDAAKVAFGEAVFQLQFGPVEYCATWNTEKKAAVERSILNTVEEVVTKNNASSPIIQEGVITCQTAPNIVTYRARVFGLQALSAVQCIQDWVSTSPTVQIEWYLVDINSNCTTLVVSFDDSECEQGLFHDYPQFSLCSSCTDTTCVNTCLINDCT